MKQKFRLRVSHFLVPLLLTSLAKAETSSKALEEEFKGVIVPSYDGSFIASQDDVVALMRRGIAERDTKFLIGLMWTRERLVFNQVLQSVSRLPVQEQYEFLGLLVAEDSFWRNVNFETDDVGEIQARQQNVVAAGVEHMIQQEVSIQDFYDLERRRELQRIVADVLKNGLPNRDPNWKPREFVGDASPKRAITIEDPFKQEPTVAAHTALAPSPQLNDGAKSNASMVTEAPKHSRTLYITTALVAIIVFATIVVFFRTKRQQ